MDFEERLATWRQLQWATSLIMNRFRRDLAAQGLTIEEFDVLIHLVPHRGMIPLGELTDSMVIAGSMSRSGITRLLDRLEAAGLVRRALNREDRRRFDVGITAKGRSRYHDVWPKHEEGIRQYFSDPLSDSDISRLNGPLRKLIEANHDRAEPRSE